MKYIEVPSEVVVTSIKGEVLKGEDGQPVTVDFVQFVIGRLTDPKFSANMKSVLAAVEIRQKLKEANGTVELENEHYNLLKDVVETPSPQAPYTPGLAHNLVDFMKAVIGASDNKPEKRADAPAAKATS